MLRRGEYEISWSRVNLPLALFLLAGLLSLLIGAVTWNPAVPRSWRFVVVQLAQWSIFAFSAFAFWLTANLLGGEAELRGLSFLYLSLATALAVLRVMPGGAGLAWRFATHAIDRAPFWALLVAVAGGQLLFNRTLAVGWRLISIVALLSALVYAFVLERDTASNWIGVATVLGALVWLRWPTLRWVAMIVVVVLTLNGFLYSAVYDFAGGDEEWRRSGGSRLALIMRVIDVTMRNPVTGLGPAAYRPYSRVKPLSYGGALYATPNVSSHNNYVDLFSHVGLLGLGLFVWLAVEVTSLAFRLRTRYAAGFAAGYVNGMLAAWAGALVLMVLADWILPFVYNIGFRGFQASLLIWLFLGGLGLLEKEVST
jgi:hypothetical protein